MVVYVNMTAYSAGRGALRSFGHWVSWRSCAPSHLDPSIQVKAIALPVLRIEPCPAVRLVRATLAQHRRQRQGSPRLLRRAAPRQMAQPRDGASTGGATREELPQK